MCSACCAGRRMRSEIHGNQKTDSWGHPACISAQHCLPAGDLCAGMWHNRLAVSPSKAQRAHMHMQRAHIGMT